MRVLTECCAGSDAVAIKKAIEALTQETGDFAARRMDRSIRRALEGRTVDDVL